MIKTLKLTVAEADAGTRVDKLVAERRKLARSYVQQLIKQGDLTLNGEPVKASHDVHAGERIVIKLNVAAKVPIEIPIIYQDADVIVFDKPAGLLTHSKGAFNPEFTVADTVQPLTEDNVPDRAGIVHRLDRDTSGVLIAAKTLVAKTKLQQQFAQRTTKKTYLAVVEGVLAEEVIVKVPIERNPKHPQTFRAGANGKPAETLVIPHGNDGHHTLVELRPLTGRTHQLRVHLAHLGHPIVGDRLYGQVGERLMLHAWKLELTLLGSQRKVFTAKPPVYFTEAAKGMGEPWR